MPKRLHNIFLYLYSFVLPFEYWDPFGLVGVFSIVRMIAIGYVLLSIVNYSYSFRFSKSFEFVMPLFFLLIAMIFSNLLMGIFYPEYRPIVNSSFLQNILLFWLIANHISNDHKLFYHSLFAFAIGIIILGLLFSLGVGIVYRANRLSVFGDNPNNQATKVAVGICLLIYFVIRDTLNLQFIRYLLLIPIPLLLNFIAESGSRGGLLTLLIGLLLIAVLLPIKRTVNRVLFYIFCAIGMIYLYSTVVSNELINQRMQEFTEEGSLGGREDIWEVTFTIFKKSPIFGVGESGFVHNMMHSIIGSDKSAHNYFLYVLTTSGIIGFIFFIWFLVKIFWISRLLLQYEQILQMILFIIVVFAMLRSGGSLGDKFYWFVFASIVGVYFSLKQNIIVKN